MDNNLNPNMQPAAPAPTPAQSPAPTAAPVQPQPVQSFVPPVMQQMPQSTPPVMPSKSSGSAASLIALIVILALLALGAFYFWSERMEKGADQQNANDALQGINTQSSSDLETDIEADLNSTDIEGVDYDLDPENFNAS